MLNILLLIFFITVTSSAQQKNPDEILNEVKKKFETVKDYVVDLNIEVDMEFLRMPNVLAKVYFKQPNRMKMESDDFAVLPKEGVNYSPAELLKHKYSAIYVKADTLDNFNVDVIKIIPLEDTIGIVLTTLWIDVQQKIIRKIVTTTKNRGTFRIKLFYDGMEKYSLPAKMQFTFSVENVELPETLTMETSGIKKPLGKINKNFAGNITITYSNYKVNRGIEDSFFDDKK